MDEHDQDPELADAIAAHPAGGADPPPEDPGPAVDEWGIPVQAEFELVALHDALAKARQNLAVNRLNYFLLARVGGIAGHHPGELKGEIAKMRSQIELIEDFLRSGEIPPEPGLEVPETPELVVAGRIPEGAGADS